MYTVEIMKSRGIAKDDVSELIYHNHYAEGTVSYKWENPNARYAFASSHFINDERMLHALEHLKLDIVGYYSNVFLLKRRDMEDISEQMFPLAGGEL